MSSRCIFTVSCCRLTNNLSISTNVQLVCTSVFIPMLPRSRDPICYWIVQLSIIDTHKPSRLIVHAQMKTFSDHFRPRLLLVPIVPRYTCAIWVLLCIYCFCFIVINNQHGGSKNRNRMGIVKNSDEVWSAPFVLKCSVIDWKPRLMHNIKSDRQPGTAIGF